MLEKTKKRNERKSRDTWCGYYTRVTPTKTEKLKKIREKHKKGIDK